MPARGEFGLAVRGSASNAPLAEFAGPAAFIPASDLL